MVKDVEAHCSLRLKLPRYMLNTDPGDLGTSLIELP
jgi:hypothetical protein